MRKWSNPESVAHGGGRLVAIEPFTGMRVTVAEGDGTSEDPIRHVVHIFDAEGFRVAVNDSGKTGTVRADVDHEAKQRAEWKGGAEWEARMSQTSDEAMAAYLKNKEAIDAREWW